MSQCSNIQNFTRSYHHHHHHTQMIIQVQILSKINDVEMKGPLGLLWRNQALRLDLAYLSSNTLLFAVIQLDSMITAIAVTDRFVAIGSNTGYLLLLDAQGNVIKVSVSI